MTSATATLRGQSPSFGMPGYGAHFILGLVIVVAGAALVWSFGSASAPSPAFERAALSSLSAAAPSVSNRLVKVSTTGWGDFTVQFVLREDGRPADNRAAALADVEAIARAVYQTPEPPLNMTILGVWSPAPNAATVPLVYASLPADRLVGLDWRAVQPEDLERLGAVRWLSSGLCQAWHEC
jgi:hypothetical protein